MQPTNRNLSHFILYYIKNVDISLTGLHKPNSRNELNRDTKKKKT